MQNLNFVRYSRYSISRFRGLNNLKNSYFFFSSTPTSPIRPDPPPIRVTLTESAGRGVFSTRQIVAGETIHSDKPVLSHPSLAAAENVCHLCLRKILNHDRAVNPRVSFCGEGCEEQAKGFHGVEVKSDWIAYNDYCRSRGLKYPLLVKRFVCMVISGAVSSDCLDILQPSSLSTQMVSEMEEGFHLLNSAFGESNVPDQKMAFMTKEWYIGVLARIRINAFRIELIGGLFDDILSAAAASVEAEASVGNAVYMLTSFYNHDCDPNVHITWIDNADAKLTALREVEEGEELRICYIDASMSRDSRQTILSQGFGFQCNCLRCLSGE